MPFAPGQQAVEGWPEVADGRGELVEVAPGVCEVGESVEDDKTVSRRLLKAGLCAGPLFIAVFTLDGATRADYRPRSAPTPTAVLILPTPRTPTVRRVAAAGARVLE